MFQGWFFIMMKLTVLVDNWVTTPKIGLLGEWGYSALLETPSGSLLIDAGETGHTLLNNMRVLGLSPESVNCVALSHGHNDHAGGLPALLEAAPQVRDRVFASPLAVRERFEGQDLSPAGGAVLRRVPLRPVQGAVELLPGVFAFDVPPEGRDPRYASRGLMYERGEDGTVRPDTFADDLSFLVSGSGGWALLLGCAHAALPNIVARVRDLFGVEQFDLVAGGAHMMSLAPDEVEDWVALMASWRVRRWRLNHCTGFRAAARLARAHPDVDWAGVGSELEL